jgi:hypothetical protein
MTWKSGDSVSLPVEFQTAAGAAQTYANAAAFTGASGNIEWYNGTALLSPQPTWTLAPIGVTGVHALTFALPAGVNHIRITLPAGIVTGSTTILLPVGTSDSDSIAAQITAGDTVVVPIAGFSQDTQNRDFTTVEGDSFVEEFTIPASALVVYNPSGAPFQFADLSDISGNAWRIDAVARGTDPASQIPGASPAFTYLTTHISKTARTIAIGFDTAPAGAVVNNTDGAISQRDFDYDIQLRPPVGSTYAAYKLTVVRGKHTITRQRTTV